MYDFLYFWFLASSFFVLFYEGTSIFGITNEQATDTADTV